MKKASIIIPCYNCEKLLPETLDYLKKQTVKDFEVICVNDGSSDNTLDVIKKYVEEKELDIVLIDKPNGGVSSARNCAMDVANGEYILFLDSDDIYHPEFLEQMLGAVNNADVAYCKLSRNLDVVKSFSTGCMVHTLQTQEQAMDKLLFEMGNYGFYCYIYKKSVVEEIGLRFDENTKFGEDREFNWKYMCHCNNAAWVDMPLYGYRINNESATRKGASWRKTDSLSAVKRVEEYLDKTNCPYADTYKSYMYARVMWATAKTFAVNRDKKLFDRLVAEYDVKTCMKRTAKDSNKLVKIASLLYLANPNLFYLAVGAKG